MSRVISLTEYRAMRQFDGPKPRIVPEPPPPRRRVRPWMGVCLLLPVVMAWLACAAGYALVVMMGAGGG